MVNGKVLLDEVISFFRNSYIVRPTSLEGKKCLGSCPIKKTLLYQGKLTLGKGRLPGFWYQYQGEMTNLNVFG